MIGLPHSSRSPHLTIAASCTLFGLFPIYMCCAVSVCFACLVQSADAMTSFLLH